MCDYSRRMLHKMLRVSVPRPLRILESGEIRPLFSFRKPVFHPSPLFATALQLLKRHNTCNSDRSLLFLLVFNSDSKFFRCYRRNYCCCCCCVLFRFSAKMVVSDVSQKYDVKLRKFKNLKHQNILAFTV